MGETPTSGPHVLQELLGAMRNLLTVIDDREAGNEEALLAAWKRCSTLSTRFQGAAQAELTDEGREEVREHLATATRLNAIAAHLVHRESERVSAELARLHTARKVLREQIERGADRGGSVDLAG
jgi:hypothetical protein